MRAQRFLPMLIVIAAVVAYANSFSGPFIFDDNRVIVQDPHIDSLWPIALKSRLVTAFSFRLNYAVSGMNYADYHLVNLVLHAMAGLLLYGIARRTFLLPGMTERYGGHASWLALMAALLWTVHPLQTESVTYICQRFEVLMGLFFLLSFYAFIRGATATGHRPRVAGCWFLASVLSCVVGMGTKEIMVTLPVMVVLYDYVFLARGKWMELRKRFVVHAALLATWSIYLGLMFWEMSGGDFHATGTVFHIPIQRYLFTEFGVMVHYLRLAIIPHPLCLDYAWLPAAGIREIALPGLAVVTLGLLSGWALWRRAPAGFLGAWFFVILAPTSSIMPIADAAFEHRMYLPVASVMVLLLAAGYRLLGWLFRHTAASDRKACLVLGALVAVVTAAFVWLTHLRNEDYHFSERMWRDVVEKREHNFRAAIALVSSYLDAGELDKAAATAKDLVARIDKALQGEGSHYLKGRANTFYHSAHNQLGRVLFHRKDLDGAMKHFLIALSVKPDYTLAHYNISLVYVGLEKWDDALRALDVAITLDADYAAPYRLKGLLLTRMARYREGRRAYERAIELSPRDASAKLQLAWLLSVCPEAAVRDGAVAVRLALDVEKIMASMSYRTYDVLAAAYAEAGDYAKAIVLAERAIRIFSESDQAAQSVGDPSKATRDTRDQLETRRQLYLSGKPYRAEVVDPS